MLLRGIHNGKVEWFQVDDDRVTWHEAYLTAAELKVREGGEVVSATTIIKELCKK